MLNERVAQHLVGQGPVFAPPKADASIRTVALSPVVLEALAAHLEAFPVGPDGLVVPYRNGRAIRRNRFGYMWRQSLARAGLATDFRYHDLRHYFASVLIAGGCSPKEVQKALGDASTTVVFDTYGHLMPDSEDRARQAVQAALGNSVPFLCHGKAPETQKPCSDGLNAV